MDLLNIKFNQFFNYNELTSAVLSLAKAKPDLCRVHSIGKSIRGRDLWLLEVTNFNKGEANHKPGFYIDACIHAEEVMGTNVALYIAWHLINNYEQEELVTQLLNEQVFYIIPRVNPDGAEFCIETGQPWCGNGRYLPGEEQPDAGLYMQDLDENGVVAQMRIPDPAGEWKISKQDPRLMVLRKPYERQGKFYRLLPEGMLRDFDLVEVNIPKPQDGNLNRNFPAKWFPEGRQYGAGEYPLSEPETKAVAEFILSHKNIAGVMAYHTHGGVLLRPFDDKSDESFRGRDLDLYKQLGSVGTAETDYPLISVYEDFTTDKNQVRGGTLTGWTYEYLGLPSFVTELWNEYKAAGIHREGFYPLGESAEEDELKLLRWAEKAHGDKAYVDWHPFDHPQLGQVEIGGWNRIWVYRNAPADMLEEIAHKNAMFSIKFAASLPKLVISEVSSKKVSDDGIYKISAVVGNTGYLSTDLTSQATYMKTAETVKAELTGSVAFALVSGDSVIDCGHLSGRNERRATWSQWGVQWGSPYKKVEWTVKLAGAEAEFRIRAGTPRAGYCTKSIIIKRS